MSAPWMLTSAWMLASLLLASWLARGAIAYARRRGMLDQPGQRRSHTLPTPRGGGIGIVVACLLCVPGALVSLASLWSAELITVVPVTLILVASIGWIDDHRPLGVVPRLGVQLLAVATFSVVLLAYTASSWWWLPLLLLAGGWSINLHNFMDGIDGLLAQQTMFVMVGMGWLAASVFQPALALACFCVASACLGFWIFNRPPARVFMGDVGSGSVGALIFMLGAMLWSIEAKLLWPVLIVCSSFVTDASLTLLSRFVRGRRWYTAHREHLYQWLVRSGHSHAYSARLYLWWNLLFLAPAAWMASVLPMFALLICFIVYIASVATWIVARRRLLRRKLRGARHVSA